MNSEYYKNEIITKINKELKLSKKEIKNIKDTLNKSSLDDLERINNLFERFGVTIVFDAINK